MNRPLTEPQSRWSLVCLIAGMLFFALFLGPQMNAAIDAAANGSFK